MGGESKGTVRVSEELGAVHGRRSIRNLLIFDVFSRRQHSVVVAKAEHIKALGKSFAEGDEARFYSVANAISSLIVLETIKDYERFDIQENKNSLKNASTNSSGSVPEPHEWALILLLASSLLYFKFYRNKSIKTN